MSNRRMGGLGKLSDFGKTNTASKKAGTEVESPAVQPSPAKPKADTTKQPEKFVTVNIKITRSQQEWLANTARQVRDNNDEPVPASDRVYPQHLIQVAIDLLQSSNVDWSAIRNSSELKQQLKL